MEELDPKQKISYVGMTLDAGVPPIELQFSYVNDCKFKETFAYRSVPVINSVVLGTLTESNYRNAMIKSPMGHKLCEWGIRETVRMIQDMAEDGQGFEWISCKCNTPFLLADDMYSTVKDILAKEHCKYPERLCLEFDSSILEEDPARVRQAVIDLDLLKVKTLMTGCGSNSCPVHLLAKIPLTAVIFDPVVTEQASDKKTAHIVDSLVAYIQSMGIKPILSDVMDDDLLPHFADSETYGFIPSRFYVGKAPHPIGSVTKGDLI